MAVYFRLLCGTCQQPVRTKDKCYVHVEGGTRDHLVSSVISVCLGSDR